MASRVSRAGLAIAILAAISAALFFTRAETFPAAQAALALAIIWVGMAPGLWHLCQEPAERRPLPMMGLTGVFYAVFFGLSGFLAFLLRDNQPNQPGIRFYKNSYIDAISVEALALVLAGLAVMFVAWFTVDRALKGRLPSFKLPATGDDRAILAVAMAMALGNLAYWNFAAVRALPSVGQFLQPAGYVAFAVFYLSLATTRPRPKLTLAYFCVVLPLWAARMLSTGLITSVIMLAAEWLVLRFSLRGRLPWKTLLAAVLVVGILYPHMNSFRDRYWRVDSNAPMLERIIGLAEIVKQEIIDPAIGPAASVYEFDRPVRRISLILPFSHVVETTPSKVPYWNGDTYRTLFIGWIPRLIWHDKPEERWGNEFARRYGILTAENRTMSVNVPWITELFANFGTAGLIIGMTLIGAFMGVLTRFLNGHGAGMAERAIAAGLLLPLFYQESNFTLMTGSLPLQLLSMWLCFATAILLFRRMGAR